MPGCRRHMSRSRQRHQLTKKTSSGGFSKLSRAYLGDVWTSELGQLVPELKCVMCQLLTIL
jgi:hypothetical protein